MKHTDDAIMSLIKVQASVQDVFFLFVKMIYWSISSVNKSTLNVLVYIAV